jgi:hypothetical protein
MSCKKNCKNRYANIDFDFGTPNRFDLEMAIANQMHVVDNLNTIIEDVLEGDGVNLDPDQLVNTLQGMVNLHTMHYNKLWNTFTTLFRLDAHLDGLYDLDSENDDEDGYDELGAYQ